MHSDIWASIQGIATSLAQPLHRARIRDDSVKCNPSAFADLSRGFSLEVEPHAIANDLSQALADFQQFMRTCMDVQEARDAYRIVIRLDRESDRASSDQYELIVSDRKCEIVSAHGNSLRLALVHVEDLMRQNRAPFLPLGTYILRSNIGPRITRSPIAAYRFKTGWELLDDREYYPDSYLNKLAHCGVNGIWVAGLFRNLVRTKIFPQLGPVSDRLDKLRSLVARAKSHGIGVYQFCMEPRSVSPSHPVLEEYPHIRGARVDVNEVCLCTSTPEVQEYLRQAVCELFTQVPELSGLITIFNGERITNCWLEEQYARTCPRCSMRKQVDVLAEDLNCFAEGIRRSGANAKCLAWNYWMTSEHETHSVTPLLELIGRTEKEIVWLANFEHGGRKVVGGHEIPIDEYSLSFTGPGEPFERVAKRCRETKSTCHAKLQLGTTFELPTVPYLPLPGTVYDKITSMKRQGATGTMLNWIPGGFPSLMLKAASEASFTTNTKAEFLDQLARLYWPDRCAADVVSAWGHFEDSFQQYPFSNRFLYYSPITRAPAYPLRLSRDENIAYPFNWGIDRHRRTQPFEESFERWAGPLTIDQIVTQLRTMSEHWDKGLNHLRAAATRFESEETRSQLAVASAVAGHLRCTMHIISYFKHRAALLSASSEGRDTHIQAMRQHLVDHIDSAARFIEYIQAEPAIGFHSEILAFSYDADRIRAAIDTSRETLVLLDRETDRVLVEVGRVTPAIPPDLSVGVLDVDGD